MNLFKQTEQTTTTTTSCISLPSNCKKIALCCGINDYQGSQNDLRGCINDAKEWAKLLSNHYGFTVNILTDSQCTKNNIKDYIDNICKELSSNDLLVITYSGHGTRVKDSDGDESDGMDEAICLYDGNVIDDDICAWLSKIQEGVNITIISDSCHSASVTRAYLGDDYKKARFIEPELMELHDIGQPPKSSMWDKSISQNDMNHMLLSGCQAWEYSYDATFNGKPMGAMSYYATNILNDSPNITWNDFIYKLAQKLPSDRYPQKPSIEGSLINKNKLMFN